MNYVWTITIEICMDYNNCNYLVRISSSMSDFVHPCVYKVKAVLDFEFYISLIVMSPLDSKHIKTMIR